MPKFVRFAATDMSPSGPPNQSVYINPEHVRIVRKDYEYGGGTVIGLVGYDVSVREDLDEVIGILTDPEPSQSPPAMKLIGSESRDGRNSSRSPTASSRSKTGASNSRRSMARSCSTTARRRGYLDFHESRTYGSFTPADQMGTLKPHLRKTADIISGRCLF
jgi:hypothetical protein